MNDRLSEELIEEIRRRNDIVEVISGYVTLKKGGKSYKGLCPFHSERDASFTVNQEKQLFKCFGCGQGGNVITFVMKADNLPFTEALEKLARRAGITIERTPEARRRDSERQRLLKLNELACRYYGSLLAGDDGRAAREYLEDRQLGGEMIKEYRLGYARPVWSGLADLIKSRGLSWDDGIKAGLLLPRNGGGVYDRFRGRVLFPIFNMDGDVVGFGGRAMGDEQPKYLNTPETPVFMKGRLLYGLYQGREAISHLDEVVVVEGYTDVLSCHRAGIRSVVASLGTALTMDQVRLIARYTKHIKLCYDADSAGMAAALRGVDLFERETCEVSVVTLDGGMDPDEFVRKEGSEAFRRKLAEASSLTDYRMAMAVRRHPENGQAVLKEMLPVLAGMRDEVRLSRVVTELARRLAGEHAVESQVLTMERAIRHELGRVAGSRRRGKGADGGEFVSEAITAGAAGDDRYRQSERELLRVLLHDPAMARRHMEGINESSFEDAACRWLFARIMESRGQVDRHRLALEGGQQVETLIADLEMDEYQLTERHVRDYVERLAERSARQRLLKLEDEIRTGIEKGEISSADERFIEYRKLRSYLDGRNPAGL